MTKYLDVLRAPTRFFVSMKREGGYLRPALRVAAWSFSGAVIILGWEAAGLGPFAAYGGVPAAAWGLIMAPLTGVGMSFVCAALLHLLCHLLGGRRPFEVTYRVVAALSVFSPISALLGPLAFGFLIVWGWLLYATVAAVVEVHAVPKKRAWAVLSVLTTVVLLGSWKIYRVSQRSRGEEGIGQRVPLPQEGSLTPEQIKAMEEAEMSVSTSSRAR